MATILTSDEIEKYRRDIKLAAPYDPNDDFLTTFDGPKYTQEEELRMQATRAKYILNLVGIPLEED